MKIKKILFIFISILVIILVVILCYLFVGLVRPAENISWGMNFSQRQAEVLQLDWKETYTALLKDMGVRKLKVSADWDFLNPQEGVYNFDDLDWQVKEAENYNAKILLAIGIKTPRWPECHIPDWASNMDKKSQQEAVLDLDKKIVDRYKDSKTIWGWQVENEPFFLFGECTWVDKDFLKEEIAEVKTLDPSRPVMISDTGEMSLWFQAAQIGDIAGTTMYRRVWLTIPGFIKKNLTGVDNIGVYIDYPFPPVFYGRKAQLIGELFHKAVVCVELQAEPWVKTTLEETPLIEQQKTMNPEQFKKNIEFAKQTGLKEFYLWGGEWMYWMKTVQNDPAIWNEAKKLFNSSPGN